MDRSFIRKEFMAYNKTNRLPPLVDPNEFNKNKVSKEFLDKCKKAGKLLRHKETEQEQIGKDE